MNERLIYIDRSHLKIATISIGQTTKPWSDEDLQEIKVEWTNYLEILDGDDNNDLPF